VARERGDISVFRGRMFKKLFGSKGSGGGGGGGPAAGGGGFGAPKTSPLSAVEKLKDVRAPARCSPMNKNLPANLAFISADPPRPSHLADAGHAREARGAAA